MSARVYVGGLDKYTREKDIERFFQDVGRVREISLKNGFCFVDFDDPRDAEDACYEKNGRDLLGQRVRVDIAKGTPHGRDREMWGSSPGTSGSAGFSGGRDRGRDYHRDRDDRGRNDRYPREGRDPPHWLIKYGPPIRTDYRVIVENLSSRVSWQDLKNYVSKGVEVSFAEAHKPRRHEAILEFSSEKDMRTAIDKFDGADLNGRRIKLFEESRERRRSRSGGSRSRSRSPRSRSKSGSETKSKGKRPKSKSRSLSPPPREGSVGPLPCRSRSRSRSDYKDDIKKNESPMKDGE